MERKTLAVPSQILGYFLFCAGGILAFVAIGLYPNYQSLKELDQRIENTRMRIEEQKVLQPFYHEFQTKISRHFENSSFPQRSGLPEEQVDRVPVMLSTIAGKSGLQVESVVPNVEALHRSSSSLSVDMAVGGDFFLFQGFLTELERLPYLEAVDSIRIQEREHGKQLRLGLRLLISEQKPVEKRP